MIGEALEASDVRPADGEIVVVASKVISKAEGRRLLENPEPGREALRVAGRTGHSAGEVEAILGQSREVLRAEPGVLVVETHQGFICANAGIDRSNTGQAGTALLLPEDSDASAERIRADLVDRFGAEVAVLVSDTFGRPFRYGLVNVALGVAGMAPIRDHRGRRDSEGRSLQGTEMAIADEICAAAELVMNKVDRVPVALVRGYDFEPRAGSGRELLRDPATDYFR